MIYDCLLTLAYVQLMLNTVTSLHFLFFFLFFFFFFFLFFFFFFSSRRRHTRSYGDWSSDVCSSDLLAVSHFLELNQRRGQVRLRGRQWFHLRQCQGGHAVNRLASDSQRFATDRKSVV